MVLLDAVYQSERDGSRKKVVKLIERQARAGELPANLQALVRAANARRGKKGRTLSRGAIDNWIGRDDPTACAAERIVLLVPRGVGKDYTLPEDVATVLALYRQPNKPALAWCAQQVAQELDIEWRPLYLRANRYKKKLPSPLFNVGRHTGAALKALQPFRRREFLSLAPNDVWVGDGHGAKLKVAHPVTGSPFVPEVTVIMDVATRYVVGWSVSLSENCLAVSDALRHAVSRNGVPLIYYSDGGGGQTNRMLDAPVTGTLGTLGIHHEVGLPSNPQARGVIERFWSTVLISLARRFATFQGGGADRETLRAVSQEIDRALRASKRGDVVALPRKLPPWQQFIDAVEAAIADYNEAHQHRSLPKLSAHHATPAEYRAARINGGSELHAVAPDELATLFMPAVMRKAARGEVRHLNGIYFHRDLMLVDGEDVKVCYDVHDAARVWVRKLTGELIAVADLDGNRAGFMPKPLIERLGEQRAKRRRGRLELQIAEVDAELAGATRQLQGVAVKLQPVSVLDAETYGETPAENVVALPSSARPMFDTDPEKYRWLNAHPGLNDEDDAQWIAAYRSTDEWADLFAHKETAARA